LSDNVKWLTRAAFLLTIALLFQFIRLGQFVTGPAINAALLIATVLLGPWGGVGIGALTPVTAFFAGVLKPVLAPAIPFIVLGNASLCLVFGFGRRANSYLAVVVAAVVKFAVMSAGVHYLVPILFGTELPPGATVALTWPQLLTALAGAILAFLVLEGLARAGVVSRAQWPGLTARVGGRNTTGPS